MARRIRTRTEARTPRHRVDQRKANLEQRIRGILAVDYDLTLLEAGQEAGVSEKTIREWKRQREGLWTLASLETYGEARGTSRADQIANLARLSAVVEFLSESLLSSHSGSRKLVERLVFARLLDAGTRLTKAVGLLPISLNTATTWRNRIEQLEKEARANWQAEDESVGIDDLPWLTAGVEATLAWAGQVIDWEDYGLSEWTPRRAEALRLSSGVI